jgi:hypothetical protein
MDLVTVFNGKFAKNALNLLRSYKFHSYDQNIYLYHFGQISEIELDYFRQLKNVNLIRIPEITEYAYEPGAFFYKTYALNDVVSRSDKFIYSDSANCFVSSANNIENDLEEGSLFLPYPQEILSNQYWTTKKCFSTIDGSEGSEIMPQYWAGFQVYQIDQSNRNMIEEMYYYSKTPDALLPNVGVDKPDGIDGKCIQHRCDQSIFSIMIHKYDKHQRFDLDRANKYGDWQTFKVFDPHLELKTTTPERVLMPRESKFGYFRFLQEQTK